MGSKEPEDSEQKSRFVLGAFDEVLDELQDSISAKELHKRHWIVDTTWFNIIITVLVGLNTLQLGVEADHPHLTSLWLVSENFFTAAFFIEMLIKVTVLKFDYLHDKANWLDAALTIFGVLDCWILSLLPGDSVDLQSMSILRIFRLARLGRVVRLARRVKQFLLVISGVFKALGTTIWVFLLLIFVIYVCAIFCTEYIGRGSELLYPGYSTDMAVIDEQEIMANFNPYLAFGDMRSSMLTLFNIAIGGEWAEVVRPLAVKQPIYVVLFAIYAMLMAFGLMNVMMAIIVDSVIAESKKLDKEMQEQHKTQKRQLLQKIEHILQELDTNRDDAVDAEELKRGFNTMKDLQDLLAQCDLPAGWTAAELLFMLDNSGDGILQKNEFTTSFFRLIDSDDFQEICIMQSSLNQVKHLVRQAHDKLEIHMAEVRQTLCQIQSGRAPDSTSGTVAKQIMADTDLDGENSDDIHCDYDEMLKRGAQNGSTSSLKVDTELDGETRDEIHADYDETHKVQQQAETQNDSCTLPLQLPVPLDMPPTTAVMQVADSHLSEEPVKHREGFTNGPLKAESLQRVRSIPFKKITDLFDVSFLAMKDALCEQIAILIEEEEMCAISRNGKAAIPADGVTGCGCYPAQPLGALQCAFTEMKPSEDAKESLLLKPCQHASENQYSSFQQGRVWQPLDVPPIALMLDGPPIALQSLSGMKDHVDQNSGPVAAETGEDFESVASESHLLAGRPREKNSSMLDNNLQAVQSADHAKGNGLVDVMFEHEEKLGFEIQWHPNQLPLVGIVLPGSASDLRGVLEGDQLVHCNGMSIEGKCRDDALLLLKQRPLVLSLWRDSSMV